MKKVYLAVASLLFASVGFSQSGNKITKPHFPMKMEKNQATSVAQPQLRKAGLGDIIWEEDFSNGFAGMGVNGTWTNDGTSANADWEYRGPATTPDVSVGSRGGCSSGQPISSASAANGFMIFDSGYLDDPSGSCAGALGSGVSPAPHNGKLTSPAIDLSTFNAVNLLFTYSARNFQADFKVNVSSDGGSNWTQLWIGDFSDSQAETVALNVSTLMGGSNNAMIQFEFDGDYYEWMIDDVQLVEGSPYDLSLSDPSFMHWWYTPTYTMLPRYQADSILVGGRVTNVGGSPETNVYVNATADNGVDFPYDYNSITLASMAAGDDSLLTGMPYFLPEGTGVYDFTMEVFGDNDDGNPLDNTLSATIEVTDTVMAREDGTISQDYDPTMFVGGDNTAEWTVANFMELSQNETVSSISFYAGATTQAGVSLTVELRDGDLETVIASSDFYVTSASDAGSLVTVPLVFTGDAISGTPTVGGVDVLGAAGGAGNYFACVKIWDGFENITFGGGFEAAVQTSYINFGGSWGYTTSSPVVRLNTAAHTFPCDDLAITAAVSDIACNGGAANGSVALTVDGGTSPYTFDWSTGETAATETNLGEGRIDVAITDANGCTKFRFFEISEPAVLDITGVTSTNDDCEAGVGTGTANVTGGTAPYHYMWDGGSTAATATGLSAGMEGVTVTDDAGCEAFGAATVTSTQALVITATFNSPSCGTNDGNAGVTVTSGAGTSYSYSWSNGDATNMVTGLGIGAISVDVTDMNNCVATMEATLVNPGAPTVTAANAMDALCNAAANGTASISVTLGGGATSSSYEWAGNGSTTNSATGLAAGDYSITITDNNNCANVTEVSINEPEALAVSFDVTDATCNGDMDGSVMVMVTGGTTGYDYEWDGGSTTNTSAGLGAGEEVVTITDANGCTLADSDIVGQPNAVNPNVTNTNISCAGDVDGSANVASVSGGNATTTYVYAWDNNNESTAMISGLTAGSYGVTVTDAMGCTGSDMVTVTEPTVLAVTSAFVSDADCNGVDGGSATASSTGGTGAITYNWGNSVTGNNVTTLATGAHFVTATDMNGCTAVASSAIVIDEPTAIAISVTTGCENHDTGVGQADGTASATATGGTGALSFSWSNSVNGSSTGGLVSGSITVTVTDANSCVATASGTVSLCPVSVNDITSESTFAVYPNPNNGSFVVELNGEAATSLVVRNVIGQVVYTKAINTNIERIDLENAESGIYFVSLVGTTKTARVIVK